MRCGSRTRETTAKRPGGRSERKRTKGERSEGKHSESSEPPGERRERASFVVSRLFLTGNQQEYRQNIRGNSRIMLVTGECDSNPEPEPRSEGRATARRGRR